MLSIRRKKSGMRVVWRVPCRQRFSLGRINHGRFELLFPLLLLLLRLVLPPPRLLSSAWPSGDVILTFRDCVGERKS